MYRTHAGLEPKKHILNVRTLTVIFKTCCRISIFSPQNAMHFIMFVFFGSYSAFYLKFVPKLKYPALLPKG